jgi:SPP1 gp7 family putative phage head morphogenesis protein
MGGGGPTVEDAFAAAAAEASKAQTAEAAAAAFAALVSLEEIEAILIPAIYDAMAASLSGATREEILAAATKVAGEMASKLVDDARDAVLRIVEQGLKDQIGIDAIARQIEDVIGLNAQQGKQLLKYKLELEEAGEYTKQEIEQLVAQRAAEMKKTRAETIARTETRRAIEDGELQVSKSRGDTHKMSLSVGDARVSDVCQACEAQGVVKIDAFFDSGEQTPPHHPNCRCTLAYVRDTGSGEVDRAENRQKSRAEKTEAAKAQGDG